MKYSIAGVCDVIGREIVTGSPALADVLHKLARPIAQKSR